MKLRLLVLFAVTGLQCAIAGDVAGTWEGYFTRGADRFHAGSDLDVKNGRITGAAYVQGWGYSRVSDGQVEGDRFRFTVDRKFAGDGPISKIGFEGSIDGKTMTLVMSDRSRQETTLSRVGSQVTGPVSVDAAPADLEGHWSGRWVGRIGDRPKMIGRIDFDLNVEGNRLSGVAHMKPAWPGDCPITNGTVSNGRFSFTATGLSPSSSGIPVMRFEGEIHGAELKMTMRHQIFGGDNGTEIPMDATRK